MKAGTLAGGNFAAGVDGGTAAAGISEGDSGHGEPGKHRTEDNGTGGAGVQVQRGGDPQGDTGPVDTDFAQTQSEELWNKPFALVLVLLIATGEWLLRKSAGLI